MQDTDKKAAADRRGFLKLAGTSVIAGGTAIVTGADSAKAETGVESGGRDGQLYRETEHVKTYYRLAR
jgi:hypothetical protein